MRQWKWRFVEVAREVCPGWQIDSDNRKIINDVFCWCMSLPGSLDPQRGLLFTGGVGSGKSTLLQIVRKFAPMVRLSPLGTAYRFRITPTIDVVAAFNSSGYQGIEEYCSTNYQAFDDLGCEPIRVNYYGTSVNVMEHVLLARYGRWNDFTHMTSNLSMLEILRDYGERIYDRCKEMFNIVTMDGRTWRGRDTP